MLKIWATFNVIASQCLIAIFLKYDFPKIVKPAIIDEISEAINIGKNPELEIDSLTKMLAPAAPDKIPQTSPITSLKIELNLSAFLIKYNAVLLPLTFLAAIAVNGSTEQVATARPIMSKIMLIIIKTIITTTEIAMFALLNETSLSKLKPKERDMATNNTFNGHAQ